MDARTIALSSIRQAVEAIDAVGSGNSRFMASRAIHINVLVRNVPGFEAKLMKTAYNDIGAEVAISHAAYHEEEGSITDMIVMGTVYQHREVRRILMQNAAVQSWLKEIELVTEPAEEIPE
ncbi:MAG TPA: hypothetical protein VK463_21255 [Desulfomonilaceae bacterium]|nr:hypothetical protein [Desulfomonilaceae bacterium]